MENRKSKIVWLISMFLAVAMGWAAFRPLPSAFAQSNLKPIVNEKYTAYGPVTATATGNLWATAQSATSFANAIVYWTAANSPATCTLIFNTGPTAATATLAVDDPNHSITCTSSGQHVIGAVNSYFNINVSAISGASAAVTVYVTLTNFAGNALNQTLSTVVQGNQGTIGQAWFVQPGNGTTGFKDVKAGVSAQGAGVQQTLEIGTISAAVASNTTAQVVAAPGAGLSTVIMKVWLEKATNTTGYVNVITGTGTNCGTNTATLFALGPSTASSGVPLGPYFVGVLAPANYEVCLQTDASTTSARVVTQ
jgi:hypothetical protein